MVPKGETKLGLGDHITIVGSLECVEDACQLFSG